MEDVPNFTPVEELDYCGNEKEREEPRDDCFIGHPQVMFMKPHGIVQSLSEVGLAPIGLLV